MGVTFDVYAEINKEELSFRVNFLIGARSVPPPHSRHSPNFLYD